MSPQIPLSLASGPCWELEERSVDSATFFQALPLAFPEATTAFFEGSSIAQDSVQIFEGYDEPGPYLPQLQTLWSSGRVQQFRCAFGPSLWEALSAASLKHADPELFDHFFLYAEREPLIEWPDAFSNQMWIASTIQESRISAFADALGISYKYATNG